MKQFPSIPRLADAPPEVLSDGHLWVQEKVDGANFRFEARESGLLVFGDRSRVYEEGVPEPYRHAARHVRERFDVDRLRTAVENIEGISFFGEATHHHTIEYDFDRLPSFLGFDVWSAEKGRFLPPDAVERVFDTLGLEPVNTFIKERRAADFDPASYAIPDSAWYDGPAEGVILRNKTGTRAKLLHPRYREVDETVPVDGDPEDLARRYVTDHRIEKTVAKIEDRDRPVDFDRVYERVLEDVIREEHKRLFHGDRSLDERTFRSTVAARVRRGLDDA
jgi:ATP-dependent RNA circularization protein (DNA/RNA ligase family)